MWGQASGWFRDPVSTCLLILALELVLLMTLAWALSFHEVARSGVVLPQDYMPPRQRVAPNWVIYALSIAIALTLLVGCGLFCFDAVPDFGDLTIDHVEMELPQTKVIDGVEYHTGQLARHDNLETEYFVTGPFYLRFMVQKAHRNERVVIEKVVAEVLEFTQISSSESPTWPMTMPIREDNLFVVAIDDPKQAKRHDFICERCFERENGQFYPKKYAASILGDDNPEPVLIKVDAERPGLYKFKIKLVISAGHKRSTIPVSTKTVYYEPERKHVVPAEN